MASGHENPPKADSKCLPAGEREDANGCRPDDAAAPTGPIVRLTKRADYLRVQAGRSWGTGCCVLKAAAQERGEGDTGPPRFGFTVTKRLGSAVKRNRARRRLKEAVKRVAPGHAKAGFDYVLIGRRGALEQDFGDILEDLRTAFRCVHDKDRRRRKSK